MTEEENVTSVADYPADANERRSFDTFATDRFARDDDGDAEKSLLDDEDGSVQSSEGSVSVREKRGRQHSSTSFNTPTKSSRPGVEHDDTMSTSSVGMSSEGEGGDEETKEVINRRRTRAARRVR
jgi:hypothetical protein